MNWKAALTATVIVGALVGLLALARDEGAATSATAPLPSLPTSLSAGEGTSSALALVPTNAFAVLALDSNLFEESPFEGDAACSTVPAPARLFFAVHAPTGRPDDVAFFIGATGVSPEFARCARSMIERHGGRSVAQPSGLELATTPSGIVLFAPNTILFSTEASEQKSLEARLLASPVEKQRALLTQVARHRFVTGAEDTLLAASIAPDSGWLDPVAASLGIEPQQSPLFGILSANFRIARNRTGRGEVLCKPTHCAELAEFLRRSVSDLIASLPRGLATRLGSSVTVRHPVPGRPDALELQVDRAGIDLISALLRFADGSGEDRFPGQERPPGKTERMAPESGLPPPSR